MNQTRQPRGVKATADGLQKLSNAKAQRDENDKPLTYAVIAERAQVDERTVKRFFGGKEAVDKDSAIAICNALNLNIAEIVDFPDPPPPPDAINWREVCGTMLKLRRELASNLFTSGMGITMELDDIHVPLGLLERQQKPQCRDESPERGSQAYRQEETITPIAYDEFFNNVLAKGQSPKSKGKRLTIIGEPGAGKTTQLLKIADWLLDNSPSGTETEFVKPLPIWISLAQVKKPLHQYLREDWLREAAEEFDSAPPAWVKEFTQLLKDGKVWLLLDGADEMGIADPLGTLAQSLRDPLFKNVRVVISCRLNVWEAAGNALSDFDSYKMLDFSYGEGSNWDQVKQFIDKWFNNSSSILSGVERSEASQLRAALDEPGKERIKDLARNPLRLSLLCFTWQSGQGKLPDTKAELYQVFVEALYELKKGIFPTTAAQRRDLNSALGQLALKAIEQGYKSILPQSLVSEALEKLHPELYEEALKLGWLNRVGVDSQNPLKSVYAFYHPTFQEYFAACEIEDWRFFLNPVPHNVAQGNYRIFEPQWKEVFLLWLGRVEVREEQKEEFITALLEFDDGCGNFYGHRVSFLMAAGIAELQNSSQSEAVCVAMKRPFGYFNSIKQEWVTPVYTTEEGAWTLVPQAQRCNYIKELENLIPKCPDEESRYWAADRLGEVDPGNRMAIQILEELICNSQNENTRIKYAESLGKIDSANQTAIITLIKLTDNSQDKNIRREAAESLGKVDSGNPKAIEVLTELIFNSAEEDICWQAAGSLGRIESKNPIAIKILENLICKLMSENSYYFFIAQTLSEVDAGNAIVINSLVELICNDNSEYSRFLEVYWLTKNLVTDEQKLGIIFKLKDYLFDESHKNNSQIEACYQVIWHCAQTLPYPDFYQAWHRQPPTHPEMQDITAAGNTPKTQRLNLETLPQILATATNTNPDLRGKIKLICIDGSKFLDPDNPAPEIYDFMLDLNCPERQNGEPATMQALKLYWNAIRRKSDQLPVWIFYEDPSASKPQGFSEIFLKALSKFDGAICVASDPPQPACLQGETLRWFDATEPDRIEKILVWIQAILLES